MKRLAFLSFALLLCNAFADEVEIPSYESLFKTTFPNELGKETLEALVKFDALDLMALVEPPYRRKAPSEMHSERQMVADHAHIVAERLFREKRIDEGIKFLKTMLPPQDPKEGMLVAGYVSEALLEQRRFEEAWQIANSGLPSERAQNICQYIQRTIAKTFDENKVNERSHFAFSADVSHYNLKWNMSVPDRDRLFPPLVLNDAEKEIYRKEAARALEHLLTLPQQATDANVRSRVEKYYIPTAMAAVGRSDDAYALADAQNKPSVMKVILYERRINGTPEEAERWFQKVRQLYEAEGVPGRNDPRSNIFSTPYPATNTYITTCLEFGKYLDAIDAMDVHDKRAGQNERNFRNFDEEFYRILTLNTQTDYRHNSKELIQRMTKYHEKIAADKTREQYMWSSAPDNRSMFYHHILVAQLKLGLLDDARESLRTIINSPRDTRDHWSISGSFPLGLLGEIVLYVHTHKTPEEASRIETESIEMFKNVDVANGRKWEDRYLDNYYLNLALRLMQDGKAEMGNRYLKLSLEQAEKEQARREEEAKQRGTPLGNTSSSMASLCWRLAISGEIEKAAEIANRYEPRYYMPYVHLAVAEKYVAAGEPEKAKKALKKAVEIIPKIDVFYPGLQDDFEKMAKFAVEFDDKKGFYEIMDIAIKIGEKEKWFDESGWMLRKFIRHLAEYGDKDHPLFEQTEKYADGFKDGSHRAEIYLSLGVSRAMLGDHDNARRLLKKGLDQPLEQYRTRGAFCAAIIEARSYENKR